MSWTFDIEAAQGQLVTSSTHLRFEVAPRGVVLTVQGSGPEGDVVAAVSGLRWSDSLDSFYTYLGGDDEEGHERGFAFNAPVSRIVIEIMHWPSRKPVDADDVLVQLLELAAWDRSAFVADASVLVFPRPGGGS